MIVETSSSYNMMSSRHRQHQQQRSFAITITGEMSESEKRHQKSRRRRSVTSTSSSLHLQLHHYDNNHNMMADSSFLVDLQQIQQQVIIPVQQQIIQQPVQPTIAVDVLGPSDIFDGLLIAFALVFITLFLQGKKNGINNFAILDSNLNNLSSDNINLNNLNTKNTTTTTATIFDGNNNSNNSIIFDGDQWKEMSNPESYVFYNRKRIKQQKGKNTTPPEKKETTSSLSSSSINSNDNDNVERTMVLIGLLILFVPIFSIEFFFASSRQLICDSSDGSISFSSTSINDWSEYLCSSANNNNSI